MADSDDYPEIISEPDVGGIEEGDYVVVEMRIVTRSDTTISFGTVEETGSGYIEVAVEQGYGLQCVARTDGDVEIYGEQGVQLQGGRVLNVYVCDKRDFADEDGGIHEVNW